MTGNKQRIEQEKRYDIFKNIHGDLMIKIRARMDDITKPSLIYDGSEHAILYRNGANAVILDYIHYGVRKDFLNAERILVVETTDQSIVREYVLPVQQVKKLPLTLEDVNA